MDPRARQQILDAIDPAIPVAVWVALSIAAAAPASHHALVPRARIAIVRDVHREAQHEVQRREAGNGSTQRDDRDHPLEHDDLRISLARGNGLARSADVATHAK